MTCNHPFNDGNKRAGAMSLIIVLGLNGIKLEYDDQDYIELFLKLASNEITYDKFLSWIRRHIS